MNRHPVKEVATSAVDADRVASLLTEMTRASASFKLQTAIGYAQNLLNELPSLKATLRNYRNTLTSVQGGLADGSLTQVQAKKEIKEANTLVENYIKMLLAEISVDETEVAPLTLDKLNDSLEKFSSTKNDLQTKLMRSPFFVGYTSVVPITTPTLSVDLLIQNGFKAEPFHGYSILGGQIVAGLTSDYIKSHMKEDNDGKSRTADEVFNEFVDLVKLRYRKLDLIQLGHSIPWWDTSWVWLIPSRQFKVLKSCTYGGRSAINLNVKSWGFPFDRT